MLPEWAWQITVFSRWRPTVNYSWRGRKTMYSVEVGCDAEDLAAVMSEMREWLDAQRFEPDTFRHIVGGESITIHVQFNLESKAVAFAQAFSGQLVKLSRRQPRSLRGARAAAR
jgi:hypothetical protein